MAREEYKVTILECSKELSAKQRIQIKDSSSGVKLDSATQTGNVRINPDFYAVLNIYNQKSEDKEYVNYCIVDKDGTRYYTGSNSFFNSFIGIFEEMQGEGDDWCIEAYRLPSKNRQGKDFITCQIM